MDASITLTSLLGIIEILGMRLMWSPAFAFGIPVLRERYDDLSAASQPVFIDLHSGIVKHVTAGVSLVLWRPGFFRIYTPMEMKCRVVKSDQGLVFEARLMLFPLLMGAALIAGVSAETAARGDLSSTVAFVAVVALLFFGPYPLELRRARRLATEYRVWLAAASEEA